MTKQILLFCAAAAMLGACATTQPQSPIPETVEVEPVPIRTCSFTTELKKVVIPAEYREGFAISTVENEPEYVTDSETGEVREVTLPGNSVKTPYKVLIKEEEIYYVDNNDNKVTQICGPDTPADAIRVVEGVGDAPVITSGS